MSLVIPWDKKSAEQKKLMSLLLKIHLIQEGVETAEELMGLRLLKSIKFETLIEYGFPKGRLRSAPMPLRSQGLVESYKKCTVFLTASGLRLLIASSAEV